MSTRATSLASRRAKTKLIDLLFEKSNKSSKPSIDPHSASFSQLKAAYLERLLETHPDKHHHDAKEKVVRQAHFVELKAAWEQYEAVAKIMDKTASSTSSTQTDFILFGVGCSFSDSPDERDLRSEITDQACRGWFSSGAIEQESRNDRVGDSVRADNKQQPVVSLCDEDMFVQDDREDSSQDSTSDDDKPRRRFLVDHPALLRKS